MEGGGEGDGGPGARAVVELTLTCSTPEEARAVWAAVSADDPGSVQGEVDGATIRISVGPASLSSLRTTIDDVMACFQAARGAATQAEGPDGGPVEGPIEGQGGS